MTILVCGEALYDVFVGEESPGGFALDGRIGGSAFNVAVGIARLDRPVGLLTGISTDALGDKLVRSLQREGVVTDYLKRPDAPTTLALVALDEAGGARYQFYGEGAADRQVTPADLPALHGIDALVFGCFSLLTKPTGNSFLTLAAEAEGGPLVVLDPNVRPTVEPDMRVWRERVEAFAAHADIIKASSDDMSDVYAEPALDVAARWIAAGTRMVVLTEGGRGARLVLPSGDHHVPAHATDLVDTVGAGDSFLAALLTGLAERGLLTRAALGAMAPEHGLAVMHFASAAAAITCSRRGADLPRRAEVMTG
ncbi:carbohydrate kinase [Acuticoccus sp. M5D2P5]|uniref:carbohydrate kinase family protein n=1 Tax=Acuticoccus kalidii TaxID=2910977 RepID=UPI001F221C59|nr:carbohydrate kinase [Acuticoccus kalidii]MCF3936591.1 carbohydrate kinase [Acuticoccus kalidii]